MEGREGKLYLMKVEEMQRKRVRETGIYTLTKRESARCNEGKKSERLEGRDR